MYGTNGYCLFYVPNIGTPEAVGGAASTKISNNKSSPPKIVSPTDILRINLF